MRGAVTERQFYATIDRTVEQIHGISEYKLDPALLKILFLMGLPETEQWSRFKTQQYLTGDDYHETKLKAAGFSDDNVLGGGGSGKGKSGALGFLGTGESGNSNKYANTTCNYCKKKGHRHHDCRKKKADIKSGKIHPNGKQKNT